MNATATALVRQASLLDREGRVHEAIALYRRALSLWSDLPNTWYNLALLQRKVGDLTAALASYQEALGRGVQRPEELHLNRGVIYSDHLLQHDAAEREYLAAVRLNPNYLPAWLNLGNLFEDRGRRNAALEAYEKVLAINPHSMPGLARYANMQTLSDPNSPLIQRLRSALEVTGTPASDLASVGFALGRLLDGCGSYGAAFQAYSAANHQSRLSAAPGAAVYDRAFTERYVDRMIAAFPRALGTSPRTTASPAPVFICGMFRSGSTLIEHVLGRHQRITPGGELDLLPHAVRSMPEPFPESMASLSTEELQGVRSRYLNSLAQCFPSAELVTDKRPDNYLHIGLIKALFPDAKIIHTIRDPLDNCLSVFFLHLDHDMSYALDLFDTGHYYSQYRRLMAHWKSLHGEDIIDINYDDLVRVPQPVTERLLHFLGLEWDPECLTPPASEVSVKTASVWQVRAPIYRTSSGRSRHYMRELEQLRHYLGEAARTGLAHFAPQVPPPPQA